MLGPAGLGKRDLFEAELLALLQVYPAGMLRAYPIDLRVGNVRNNDPALLAPIAA